MHLSTPSCVVWDWNGTIYDDAKICKDITNDQLEQLGLERVSYETQEMLFKHPVSQYYRDMGARFAPGQFEKLAEEFHSIYGEKRKEGQVREDAVNLLSHFRSRNVRQVVLSAYREVDLQSLVREVHLEKYFDDILGLSDYHAVSKVKRGLDWFKAQNISPESVLVIGDTNHDVEAAQAMNAQVVLVPSGYQHRNILLQTGVPMFNDLHELLEVFLST